MQQVGGADRSGACLADRDAGGRVRELGGGDEVDALAERGGERRHHRISRAGDIEHLARNRPEMGNATVGGDERHAVAAAGDQDRAQAVPGDEVAASDNDGVVGLQALPRSKPELGAVGRQHRGAGVAREVAALGIDHHRSRGALGRLYQLPHQFGRKHALGVIREHDHVASREGIPGEAEETLGRALGDRVGRLRIGAQKLLTAGEVRSTRP